MSKRTTKKQRLEAAAFKRNTELAAQEAWRESIRQETRDIQKMKLEAEAARFRRLAADAALAFMQNREPMIGDRPAQEHLVRAETYKAAARLIEA